MTTSRSEIDAFLLQEAQRIDCLVLMALSYLGERCVNYARDRAPVDSWNDHTGNLRSSIGYVITRNGEVVAVAGFSQVRSGGEGVKTGRELALELAKVYTSGYALIVVAGMNYAERVEDIDGKDVLTSPELFARRELPLMIEKLKSQING